MAAAAESPKPREPGPAVLAPEPAFEVLDVLEGFARLEKRSPTLGGSVPVRAARGCLPLLEGNAYGFQVSLARGVRLESRLGRLRPVVSDPAVEHRLAGLLPRLLAAGLLSPAWHAALGRGLGRVEGLGRPRLRLFTGLLLRPSAGTLLHVRGAANRRSTLFEVDEQLIAGDGFVPLVLTIRLPARGARRVRLTGEVACVAPVSPGAGVEVVDLAADRQAGLAHVRFYDQAYFDAKKHGVTGKYRRLVEGPPQTGGGRDAGEATAAALRVVRAGPVELDLERRDEVVTAAGPNPRHLPGVGLESVVFRNSVPFTALYDGYTLALEPDRRALLDAAQAIERTWDEVYGPGFVEAHRGALWYLTKYFTPHPPGEPYFFVKPWALVRTPPGWSSLLEGAHGDGWDVLRGVVSTDVFHATPAVFRLTREGDEVCVARGTPLLRVLPVPRRLLEAGFRSLPLPEAP